MKQTLLSLMVCFCGTVIAQKHDYTWLIGLGGTQTTIPEYGTTRINFNNNPYQLENIDLDMAFLGSSVSVMSDADGELLFYTNGCYIANAQGDTIEGGGLLNYASGVSAKNDCIWGDGYQIVWGAVSVPVTPQTGQYAIIHKDKHSNWASTYNKVFGHNLYVTRLDMMANNGKGKVTSSEIVLSDTLSYSDITACKHSNGTDWWFMVMTTQTNKFYKFLLQKDTVLGPYIQEIGDTLIPGYDICQAIFSPNGQQYARVNWCNGVMLYDFDRSTGELSNYRNFTYGCAANSDSVKLCGVGFAPNSRYLYVSGWLKMYQLDTEADDLQASAKLLGIYDGYRDTVGAAALVPQQFYVMANAPDCKIYITAPNQGRVFHMIHEPDLPAPFCDFQQHAIKIPTYRTYNIPNFAHYRLGTGNPVCDSSLSIVSAIWHVPKVEIAAHLYPNPSSGHVYLDVDIGIYRSAIFQVFDLNGRPVFDAAIDNKQLSYNFELKGLPSGLYTYHLRLPSGQVLFRGRVVIIR